MRFDNSCFRKNILQVFWLGPFKPQKRFHFTDRKEQGGVMEKRSNLSRLVLILVLMISAAIEIRAAEDQQDQGGPGEGVLVRADSSRIPIPLKQTDVKISVIGFLASIDVEQTFTNSFKENIEAIYIFPLPSE